jgi:outer membrane protein OmpA-like peptidoglycan-associated protein
MKKILAVFGIFLVLALMSCQTQKPAVQAKPAQPEPSSIAPARKGFAPASTDQGAMILKLAFGSRDAVASWSVSISGSAGPVKSYSGTAANLPAETFWDGKSDSAADAPEGTYTASLSVSYGDKFVPSTATSAAFILDRTPPVVKLTVSPEGFNPTVEGVSGPVAIAIDSRSALAGISAWTIEVLEPDSANSGTPFRSFDGTKSQDRVSWDGSSTDGRIVVPSSRYPVVATVKDEFGNVGTARIEIPVAGIAALRVPEATRTTVLPPEKTTVQETGVKPAAESADVARTVTEKPKTPPTVSLLLTPALFSPSGEAANDTVNIAVRASAPAAGISSWNVQVTDPEGRLFNSFSGPGGVANIAWDGKDTKGELVESASDYTVTATAKDEFGNVGTSTAVLKIDILTDRIGDRYRLRVSSIVFKPFTADFTDVPADRAARNKETLAMVAASLKKFPDYRITVVGHAVMVYWNDPVLGKAEQNGVLLPLSRSRAEAIRKALADLGIEMDAMTPDGVGASDQVVPDSDYANRWKNRRVEFYLDRK